MPFWKKDNRENNKKKKKRDSVVLGESTPSTPTTPDTPTTLVGSPTHAKKASWESIEELQSSLAAVIQENHELHQIIADQKFLLTAQDIENQEYRQVQKLLKEAEEPLTLAEVITLLRQKIAASPPGDTSEAAELKRELQYWQDQVAKLEAQVNNLQAAAQKEKSDKDHLTHYLNSVLGLTDLSQLPNLPPGETLTSILTTWETRQTTLTARQSRINQLETDTAKLTNLSQQIATQQTTITNQAQQLAELTKQGKSRHHGNIVLGILLAGSWLVMAILAREKLYSRGKKLSNKA